MVRIKLAKLRRKDTETGVEQERIDKSPENHIHKVKVKLAKGQLIGSIVLVRLLTHVCVSACVCEREREAWDLRFEVERERERCRVGSVETRETTESRRRVKVEAFLFCPLYLSFYLYLFLFRNFYLGTGLILCAITMPESSALRVPNFPYLPLRYVTIHHISPSRLNATPN